MGDELRPDMLEAFGYADVTPESAAKIGLFDRHGSEIDVLEWGRLWADLEYRVVACDVVIPTVMEVLTVWVGIPIPAAMFSTAVRHVDQDDFLTVSEPSTDDQARWVHAVTVDAVRQGVELRALCLDPDVLELIKPGTPGTVCRCPVLDNGYGRRPDNWQWWKISDLCALHWSAPRA